MIDLSGQYGDASGRDCVVMQDSAERMDRRAWVTLVRVMRRRDEIVRRGSVFIADETFAAAGADDRSRNAALALALVSWIAEHPAVPIFELQARVGGDEAGSIEMIEETGAT